MSVQLSALWSCELHFPHLTISIGYRLLGIGPMIGKQFEKPATQAIRIEFPNSTNAIRQVDRLGIRMGALVMHTLSSGIFAGEIDAQDGSLGPTVIAQFNTLWEQPVLQPNDRLLSCRLSIKDGARLDFHRTVCDGRDGDNDNDLDSLRNFGIASFSDVASQISDLDDHECMLQPTLHSLQYGMPAAMEMDRLLELRPNYPAWLEQLEFCLSPWTNTVMEMQDKRYGKESSLWMQNAQIQDAVPVPAHLFAEVLENAVLLAMSEQDMQKAPWSKGATLLQKMIVVATDYQHMALLGQLTTKSSQLLYHKSGAFVVSQFTGGQQRGNADDTVTFFKAALELEHEDTLKFSANLIYSMKHKHANHSVKLCVAVLVTFGYTPMLDAILQVVNDTDTGVDLVMDGMGVRSVIEILIKVGRPPATCHKVHSYGHGQGL